MTFNLDLTLTMGVIVTVVIAIIGWVQMGRKAMNDRISGLVSRLDRHEARIASAEQNLTNQPGKDDFHNLRLGMSEMKGEMREIRAVMAGNNNIMSRLEAIVTRHEEHLLDGAK